MHLQSLIPLALKTSIFLTVFSLGSQATFADATYLFRHPRMLFRGIISMSVVMPLLALLLVMTFNLHPAVKIALVALSVSPVPPLFPKNALKAGGKESYAVGLLVATVLLAIITIPITMEIFSKVTGVPLQMSPLSVAVVVFKTALTPLLLGILMHTFATAFAERVAKPIGKVAVVLLIVGVVPVLFVSMRAILSLLGDGTLLSLVAFALIGYAVGHLLGGPAPEDRSVLALATASRHPALAVAIAQANFPQQKLALPAVLLYLIVSTVVTGAAPKLMKKKSPAAVEPQPVS